MKSSLYEDVMEVMGRSMPKKTKTYTSQINELRGGKKEKQKVGKKKNEIDGRVVFSYIVNLLKKRNTWIVLCAVLLVLFFVFLSNPLSENNAVKSSEKIESAIAEGDLNKATDILLSVHWEEKHSRRWITQNNLLEPAVLNLSEALGNAHDINNAIKVYHLVQSQMTYSNCQGVVGEMFFRMFLEAKDYESAWRFNHFSRVADAGGSARAEELLMVINSMLIDGEKVQAKQFIQSHAVGDIFESDRTTKEDSERIRRQLLAYIDNYR